MSIPRKRIDWKTYDQFTGSDAAFARSIDMDPRNFAQYKKTRHRDEPTLVDVPVETVDLTPSSHNGHLPAIRSAHPSALERISALPAHPSASAFDDLTARVATLEAFMAVLQTSQRITAHPSASAHPIASQRTEPPTWVSRGVHLSTDMVQAIETYALRYRLEKREVLDRILQAFFADVGQEVGDA